MRACEDELVAVFKLKPRGEKGFRAPDVLLRGSERRKRAKRASESERSERSKLRRHALARASVSLGVGRTARGVLYFCRPLAWACRGLHAPQVFAGPGLGRRAPLFPQASATTRGDMAPQLCSLRSLSLAALASFARSLSLAGLKFPL